MGAGICSKAQSARVADLVQRHREVAVAIAVYIWQLAGADVDLIAGLSLAVPSLGCLLRDSSYAGTLEDQYQVPVCASLGE